MDQEGSLRPASPPILATNVYDLADGKIKRVRIFLDRREALEAVGLSGQDAHADT